MQDKTRNPGLRSPPVLVATCLAFAGFGVPEGSAQPSFDDEALKAFAVHINRTPPQSWPGYGVYLGSGLVLTAAHVSGRFIATKPHVLIAGMDLPAQLVKEGSLDEVDLTLLAVDPASLPIRLRMSRMPLCENSPRPGESVVVATPEGVARSHVLPPVAVPASLRARFPTVIGDVATTGNSGSGVFDAWKQCLLGVITRKISVSGPPARLGAAPIAKDIAKYFVPVGDIKAFLPRDISF